MFQAVHLSAKDHMNVEYYQNLLRPLLAPMGLLYGSAMRLRRKLYESGVLSSWRPDAVTVSVGNIGWGGSGKTPLTSWLLDWARSRGFRSLVLTRGYGARPEKYPHLVKPGHLAEEAGDEPLMLCRQHPDATIVVDPERSRGGRWAMERLTPDLIVLDDGFQHLGVRRDADLVLLKPEDLAHGWNRVIPGGSWREDATALARADAFLMKAAPERFQKMTPFFRQRLLGMDKPVFSFSIVPRGLVRIVDGARQERFEPQSYMLVTAVGDSAQVERTAIRYLGASPREHLAYPDHHAFTRNDVRQIEQAAVRRQCSHVLCTPKDAVKLGPMAREYFWTFDLDVEFGPSWNSRHESGGRFEAWWDARFNALSGELSTLQDTATANETGQVRKRAGENSDNGQKR
ncbi:MAG: tetraacyldisaccharide 4'-kinase [Desulfovibrionaceae bacterium]